MTLIYQFLSFNWSFQAFTKRTPGGLASCVIWACFCRLLICLRSQNLRGNCDVCNSDLVFGTTPLPPPRQHSLWTAPYVTSWLEVINSFLTTGIWQIFIYKINTLWFDVISNNPYSISVAHLCHTCWLLGEVQHWSSQANSWSLKKEPNYCPFRSSGVRVYNGLTKTCGDNDRLLVLSMTS